MESVWSRTVADTLADRRVPPPAVGGWLLPRAPAAAALAAALDPSSSQGLYFIVDGPPRCGKTTLLREALKGGEEAAGGGGNAGKKRNKRHGVAYIDAGSLPTSPAAGDLGRALAAAIGFSFEETSRVMRRVAPVLAPAAPDMSPDPRETLARAAAALEEGAATLVGGDGAPAPLLVVDGCDAAVACGGGAADALLALQTLAATWAARGLIVTAFVASRQATLSLLGAAPAGAAAARVTVPPPTDAEAAAWLKARGVPSASILPLVDAAGGDFGCLARGARAAASGASAAAAAASVAAEAERRYAKAGVMDAGERQGGGLAVIAALVEVAARGGDPAIPASLFRRLLPEKEAQDALLVAQGGPLTRGDAGEVRFAPGPSRVFATRGLLAAALADAGALEGAARVAADAAAAAAG